MQLREWFLVLFVFVENDLENVVSKKRKNPFETTVWVDDGVTLVCMCVLFKVNGVDVDSFCEKRKSQWKFKLWAISHSSKFFPRWALIIVTSMNFSEKRPKIPTEITPGQKFDRIQNLRTLRLIARTLLISSVSKFSHDPHMTGSPINAPFRFQRRWIWKNFLFHWFVPREILDIDCYVKYRGSGHSHKKHALEFKCLP